MMWLDITIFGVVLLTLAYFRVANWIWLPSVLGSLLAISWWGHLSWVVLSILWLLASIPALIFSLSLLRQRLITQPVLNFFKRQLPPMSATEREALEAGDVWWEGELFAGKPNWSQLLDLAAPKMTTAEQTFYDHEVVHLCKLLSAWEVDKNSKDLPPEIWHYIKQAGFLGMVIPTAYGGLGFSAYAHSNIIMKIASRSISAAVSIMVPNSLGPGELLQHYGTPEQQQYYLPRLAKGEDIPCFALTGITSGSDAANMSDRGVVCKGLWQGEEVIGIRLTFNKRYITLAPIATLLGLAIDLYDPEALLSDNSHPGISLCLIPLPHPGIQRHTRHQPIGAQFMNGPLRGQDVFIPANWIIGDVAKAGQGWRMLMECLAVGRAISLPAMATANAKLCYRSTSAYAAVRQQFKCAIGKFEGVQAALARIGGLTYMLEAARRTTVSAIDQGVKPSLASAILKYHSTEGSRQIINDAMDIHAGRGVQTGPRNYLSHPYQSIPISITVEGANILTRNLIIFGQGALRCHPYLRHEMAAATSTASNAIKRFDALLKSHLGYTLRNLVRAWVLGLSHGRATRVPLKGHSARYLQQLNQVSSQLALLSDVVLLILGGQLKRRERISARLGDVLSALYLASSSVQYYQQHQEPVEDKPYIDWVMQYCLAQSYQAIDALLSNFPLSGWIGRCTSRLLRFICFPLGRGQYVMPSDSVDAAIANHMLAPSLLRDRLSADCYISAASDDPLGCMDRALEALQRAQQGQQKLQQAIRNKLISSGLDWETQLNVAVEKNILTTSEVELLRQCEYSCWDALQVDEFDMDESNA